ncbi:hypothetical protein, partial [Neorhodopirellula pilleata]|uniref:hypothetical protein n=1 Tax=Neorhodopirellula pilleata TaxID=2714738 RepID=UPI001E618E5D
MRPNSFELSPLGHDELSRCTAAARTTFYNFQPFTGRSVIGGVIGQELSHMSFRKSKNQTDQWRAFCTKHDRYVSQLPRLAPVF